MNDKVNGIPAGEQVILRTRPDWRSFWVFFFGILLCGAGPFLKENPPLSKETGMVFAVVFLLLILKRWSNVYVLTPERITMRGGIFLQDSHSIRLADVSSVEANQGLNLRLVGAGHLLIRSRVPHEEHIIMYGQIDPFGLRTRMEQLAAEAAAREGETMEKAPAPGDADRTP